MNNEKLRKKSEAFQPKLFTLHSSLFINPVWGCSSAGRAPALQAGGHGFDSHHLHQSGPPDSVATVGVSLNEYMPHPGI